MSFVERDIEVTISLGGGQYGETVTDVITLNDHRVECAIENYGGYAMGVCQARIYGLPLSLINKLTTIGPIATKIRFANAISIAAGEKGKTLSTIYHGTINEAWGDFQDAPNVSFNVTGYAGLAQQIKPAQPTSIKGTVDAATLMEKLASEAGYGFQNDGVSAQLSNPYLSGTIMHQIKKVKEAANINYILDRQILYIWPKNGHRSGDIPTISPGNGLVGYGRFSSKGLDIRTEFLPNIVMGGVIAIEGSELSMVNGTWNVATVQHNIASQMPNGPWFTNLSLFKQAN